MSDQLLAVSCRLQSKPVTPKKAKNHFAVRHCAHTHIHTHTGAVTNLINVGSRGFWRRLALWCGPVCGLNPDGAGWPVGLYRSISTADKSIRQFASMSISTSRDSLSFFGNNLANFFQS